MYIFWKSENVKSEAKNEHWLVYTFRSNDIHQSMLFTFHIFTSLKIHNRAHESWLYFAYAQYNYKIKLFCMLRNLLIHKWHNIRIFVNHKRLELSVITNLFLFVFTKTDTITKIKLVITNKLICHKLFTNEIYSDLIISVG